MNSIENSDQFPNTTTSPPTFELEPRRRVAIPASHAFRTRPSLSTGNSPTFETRTRRTAPKTACHCLLYHNHSSSMRPSSSSNSISSTNISAIEHGHATHVRHPNRATNPNLGSISVMPSISQVCRLQVLLFSPVRCTTLSNSQNDMLSKKQCRR